MGSVMFGDYNNDGYLDIVQTGIFAGLPSTKLYRNNKNGTFSEIATGLIKVNGHSRAVWGDFDNDGFLDILICGRSVQSTVDPQPVTKLYKNNGGNGTFTEVTTASFVGVWRGSVAWGDYDNDGYKDILVTGLMNGGPTVRDTTLIYKNHNGDGTFVPQNILGLPSAFTSAAAWGDYDGDGFLDILINGYHAVPNVLHNNGNGTFAGVSLGIPITGQGAIAWGDMNNDGYLDIVLAGNPEDTNIDTTFVLRYSGSGSNSGFVANTKPNSPTGLNATVGANQATLSWNRATDGGTRPTPSTGLSYGLRVGTTPGGIDGYSPLADTTSGSTNGLRRVARLGEINENTTMVMNGLHSGKYYWSVQAIDNAFAGSAFSSQGFFALPYTIAASVGPNGTITPTGNVSILPDSSQKFIIKPTSSYRIDSLIVDGVKVASDTVYVFSTVAANHTIRATFVATTKQVSIAEARKDLDHNGIPDHLGDTLAVVGIVNSVNIQTTNFGYFIQDSSAGIHVFKTGLTGAPTLRPGYRIAVSGKIDYFRGTTEIVPFDLASDIVVVDTGNAITAIPLSISSLQGKPGSL